MGDIKAALRDACASLEVQAATARAYAKAGCNKAFNTGLAIELERNVNSYRAILDQERKAASDVAWKDGEWGYLCCLVAQHGDDNVSRDPKTVATYLRLQASQAHRDKRYRLASCIFAAATAINEDARNNHEPDWTRARALLNEVSDHE